MKLLIPSSLLLFLGPLIHKSVEIADNTQPSISQAENPCCPQPKPCCPPRQDCIPPRCAQLVGGPRGEITPNAGPCIACGMNLFVTADFLYWSIHEDHLGFVSSDSAIVTATPTHGKIFQPDFKMKPGFKVGLGMGFDHDGWDSFLEYTWIRARNIKGHASPSSTTVLEDTLWGFSPGGTINSASAEWDLHYFNVLDLELGRNFYVSRYLKIRPYFGFKGTWQKQFYTIDTQETATDDTLLPAVVGDSINAHMHQSQFFWGFGIRAGLDTAWHFSKSFSALGQIAFSGLYGQFENSGSFNSFDNTQGIFLINHVLTNDFHTIKPVLEWFVGLRWETYTCDNEYHFSFEAGWEEQFWGEQNQFLETLVEGKNGDLNFQGLTVKARFDF